MRYVWIAALVALLIGCVSPLGIDANSDGKVNGRLDGKYYLIRGEGNADVKVYDKDDGEIKASKEWSGSYGAAYRLTYKFPWSFKWEKVEISEALAALGEPAPPE